MKELACILYGSQNYGLAGPDSDKDYKVLLCPDFDDFYCYHKVDKNDIPDKYDREHYSPMSVMQFNSLLLRGNPNCLEMLYSLEVLTNNPDMLIYFNCARELFSGGYLALVWDEFYSALHGLAMNAITRNGINGKTISRAFYFYGMIGTIVQADFVITNSTWRNNSLFQSYTKDLRYGNHTQEEYDELSETIKEHFANAKEYAHSAAETFKLTRRDKAQALREQAHRLSMNMRNIVAESIYEELKIS